MYVFRPRIPGLKTIFRRSSLAIGQLFRGLDFIIRAQN